eukprot:COSAG01_NODE_57875_length_309_cov_1.357143_1_plen_47_part_01
MDITPPCLGLGVGVGVRSHHGSDRIAPHRTAAACASSAERSVSARVR